MRNSQEYEKMNVGMALDEGLTSSSEEFRVFYTERIKTAAEFSLRGQTGHGSQFLENTAGEKVNKLLTEVYSFREKEWKNQNELSDNVSLINLTMMDGGLQGNVVANSKPLFY